MGILQALGHGHILLLLAALVASVHLVSQIYLTIEAAFVWWKSLGTVATSKEASVGPPVILGSKKQTETKSTEGVVEPDVSATAQQGGEAVVEPDAAKNVTQ